MLGRYDERLHPRNRLGRWIDLPGFGAESPGTTVQASASRDEAAVAAEDTISMLIERGRPTPGPDHPAEWSQMEEALDVLASRVWQADDAWADDLGNSDKRAAYFAEKDRYRSFEKAALDRGFVPSCKRCGGTGVYLHYGTCFRCMGAKADPSPNPKRKFQAAPDVRARRDEKRAEEVRQRDQWIADTLNAHGPEVADPIMAAHEKVADWHGAPEDLPESERPSRTDYFLASMYDHLRDRERDLTPNQVEAVKRAVERELQYRQERQAEEEQVASAPPLAGGRQVLRGKVLSTKTQHSQYGTTTKMLLLLDDGNRVYGSVPSGLYGVDRGDRVELTGNVERSTDDQHFGFFSRPTKAQFLDAPPEDAAAESPGTTEMPSGRTEELALERLTAREEQERADRLWASRRYEEAREAQRRAERAKLRVAELEAAA